jgi:mersacidin/lichenicidin family type 2 lantibiotic
MSKNNPVKGVSRRNLLSVLGGVFGLGMATSSTASQRLLSPKEVVRAWEDPKFRAQLTAEQWAALPPNPAGELTNSQFTGDLHAQASWNACSGNNCSGNNCSGNNCSGNNCSGNSCSGNNCSGNNCSGNNCSGNNCSGRMCGG